MTPPKLSIIAELLFDEYQSCYWYNNSNNIHMDIEEGETTAIIYSEVMEEDHPRTGETVGYYLAHTTVSLFDNDGALIRELTPEEIEEVERLVNREIRSNLKYA